MRKFAAITLVALSLIAGSAPAFAGYWYNGVYYCNWVAGPYGWICY
jgi:hypothetical protein